MLEDLLTTLLYSDVGNPLNNGALLLFRVLLAVELFRVHGLRKFRPEAGAAAEVVPNPLGLPPALNQLVATFSDTVVPALVVLGVATRLAVLPTIGVTAIGYFVVHRHDALAVRDVPYIYTICFLLLLVLGPGTYSADHYLWAVLTAS
ncbi:DoxX family protein [Hymenobacter fodinae]|uniref:DoxX family protein n=1 Tax=Hymenobacter fodinae TaxID=2510796 RepID=A0A4Z0P7L4_9BACT|nr:DoxX family protein [Hymenobacter fodinae]TGE08372.1 DoxX family protein [Hymenobacter fodinae]